MTSIGRTVSLRGDSPPAPAPAAVTDEHPTLIICRGLPASGKTTWALHWLEEKPTARSRVNRDDLRQSLFHLDAGNLTYEQEKTVTYVQHSTIRALLRLGRDVVCDDTNLRARTVRGLLKVARQADAEVRFQDFDTPPALCIERDTQRANAGERHVGDAVIRSFAGRYLKKGELPPPPSELEEDVATALYVPDPKLPIAWIFDVDGTLAKMDGRGPFEWHRVGEDAVNEPVAEVAAALFDWGRVSELNDEERVIVVSGRDGSCREMTGQWLYDHGITYHELFMREAGDMRKDAVVKAEIFWRDIAPRFNVRGVFDDRDQVVAMWRRLGLVCFQVAPGDF
jgi:predicted kinase